MIIFLYGPDSYRRQRNLKKILALYRAKHSNLNWESFDLAAAPENPEEILKLKDFIANQSLFDDFKLAVVTGLYPAEPQKDLLSMLKIHSETPKTILIISEAEAPPPPFKFLLKKSSPCREFKELKGRDFRFFMKKEARSRNLKFSLAAERFLSEVFEPDGWALVNELEKLSLAGLKPPIEIDHIKSLSDLALKEKMFNLAKVLSFRLPLKIKLINLESLFLQKEAPPHIFNLLASIAPKSMVEKLANYDWSIKSGGLDYEEALLDLVIS